VPPCLVAGAGKVELEAGDIAGIERRGERLDEIRRVERGRRDEVEAAGRPAGGTGQGG